MSETIGNAGNAGNFYIKDWITTDIDINLTLREIRKDPVGHSFYLYYLLKNKERGYEVDRLVSLMNNWVNEILNDKNFSRAYNVEISSALFSYGILKNYDKLDEIINSSNIEEIFNKYFKDGYFFNNYLLSCIIAIGLKEILSNKKEYIQLIKNLEENLDLKDEYTDSKIPLSAYELFIKFNKNAIIEKIYEFSYELFKNNKIMYEDEIYHLYILWNERNMLNKSDIKDLRNSIENNIYDIKKNIEDRKVSKIKKGILFDLEEDFKSDTITITREELERSEISRFVLLIPLFSVILIFLAINILYCSFKGCIYEWFPQYEYLIYKIPLNTFLYFISYVLLILSGSLFYNVVYKRILLLDIILKNTITNIEKYTPKISPFTFFIALIQSWHEIKALL